MGISDKGVEWQIKQLKAKGIIRRVDGANGGHWEIVAGEDNSNWYEYVESVYGNVV